MTTTPRAAIPDDVARFCATCRLPSLTCKKVPSTNGKQLYWKCKACRDKVRPQTIGVRVPPPTRSNP